MFRRRSATETEESPGSAQASASEHASRTAPKGRPTPTRKEAEAAAKARAMAPRSRKEQAAAQRRQRASSGAKVRAAMKSGDEKHMLPRDQGPVRRFTRDAVDSRLSFLELILPLVLVTMIFTYSGQPSLVQLGSTLMLGLLLLMLVEMINLRFRLRRELVRRFPDASYKGTTWYAISRAMQMRFMRLPKRQVRLGQKLSDDYR